MPRVTLRLQKLWRHDRRLLNPREVNKSAAHCRSQFTHCCFKSIFIIQFLAWCLTHTHIQRANILYFFNLFLIPLFIEILTDGGMCEPQQGRTNHELECKWDKNMWMLVFASDTSLILVKVTLLTVRMITISFKQVYFPRCNVCIYCIVQKKIMKDNSQDEFVDNSLK